MASLMIFIFGLAIGSFLSAYIYRMEVREGLVLTKGKHKPSVWRGRSYCPQCRHSLAWYDLVPLLSFLFLRGRCRYCKGRIALQDFFMELATGLLFVVIFNLIGLSFTWAIGAVLLAVFVYDLKHSLIPDILVYVGVGFVVLWRVFEIWSLGNFGIFFNAILAGLAASAFFLAIYLVSKGKWMGFGDVKFAFLLGLFLGWPSILVALFSAFCLGAVAGLVLVACKKKVLRSEVPFAPFLIAGTAAAFFFGPHIISWYLGLFLV